VKTQIYQEETDARNSLMTVQHMSAPPLRIGEFCPATTCSG